MAPDRGSLPEGLLDDVRNCLDVTWEDPDTDRKLSGFIAGGMVYLNGKLGEEADYTADSLPRTLLMEYVRYARDSALDVFENNYRSMLLDMQNGRKVRTFELEQTLSPQG